MDRRARSSSPPHQNDLDFITLPQYEKELASSAAQLLIVVKKLIGESFDLVKQEFHRSLKKESMSLNTLIEERIAEVKATQEDTRDKLFPLLPLLDIVPPGQTLVECISNELTENVIDPRLNEIREKTLPLYATKEELFQNLNVTQEKSTHDIETLHA